MSEFVTETVQTNWVSAGVMISLRKIFSSAIASAYPQILNTQMASAAVTRCGTPKFGDYQCNNAMSISKHLRSDKEYKGPVAPKDIAAEIVKHLETTSLVGSTMIAPNGFINITISTETLNNGVGSIISYVDTDAATSEGDSSSTSATTVVKGPTKYVAPPSGEKLKILVDFSSPNIAKEMHVGHLRSTIIGDCLCRAMEYSGHDVMRVNHVGDWGTQFGMLISYLQDEYPDFLNNPPNISDLTAIYKASKKRFDAEPDFKERSRNNVVKLQSGDENCRTIWNVLCDISRKEFQKVYDALKVDLTEVGESFYNPMIPDTVSVLQNKEGLVVEDEGMLIIKLPHFEIPLILRKSDGGYGYDSTDMTAIRYRLQTLKRDWLVYITDSGQMGHFHMCFDVARHMDWVGDKRLNFIGFGVVCGEDGKKFKTRSSETVRLIDLLNEAKDRMTSSLEERAAEGKTSVEGDSLKEAAEIIGFGAVKYFDLKQNPISSYIFSYDRMLDTKGDTAVYLLFAYARVASILRKAKEERGVDLSSVANLQTLLTYPHPAERALTLELMQFQDVLNTVVNDLMPNRLCDYLKELSVKFTDFVTKCHVLNSEEMIARVALCEATKRVMAQCFAILGVGTLDRI